MAKLKPSALSFSWPGRREVTQENRENLSASLQELMKERGLRHTTLAYQAKLHLGDVRYNLQLRRFPELGTAEKYAKFFDVPLSRLLAPKGPFVPYTDIRPRTDYHGAKAVIEHKKAKAMKKTPKSIKTLIAKAPLNGKKMKMKDLMSETPHDPRWVLPAGASAPHIKLETAERPMMMIVNLTAELPQHVALAVSSMVNDYRLEHSFEGEYTAEE